MGAQNPSALLLKLMTKRGLLFVCVLSCLFYPSPNKSLHSLPYLFYCDIIAKFDARFTGAKQHPPISLSHQTPQKWWLWGASSIIILFSLISDCILLSLLHFDDFFRCTAAHLLSSWAGYNLIHSMPWSPWEWESMSRRPRERTVRTRWKRRHTFSYCNMILQRASSIILLQITLTPTFPQKTWQSHHHVKRSPPS